MEDLDVIELGNLLSLLDPLPNITWQRDVWDSPYPTQKAHMVRWARDQVNARGKGAYSRTRSNHSARTMYNRFNNPGGLLWMAEALGESPDVLVRAVDAVEIAEDRDKRGRCNAFRAIIPWSRIMELIAHPSGWLYDPALMPFEGFETDGFPILTEEWYEKYDTVMTDEIFSCLLTK